MMRISKNQLELLTFVRESEKAGVLVDLDQVLARMSWNPSKEAIQFTIRTMIAKGLISKSELQSRRGRNRVCFKTALGGHMVFDPRMPL